MRPDRGFGLIAAIFLLLVLSALAAFMLSYGATQHASAMQSLQHARAGHAARAGLEWGRYQALHSGSCPATTTLAFSGALAGFQVTVDCAAAGTYVEGGTNIAAYQLRAVAAQGVPGQVGFIESEMRSTEWR